MKRLLFALLCFLDINSSGPLYFCTAANINYYNILLNLIGSIHANNFDSLGQIAVFDLGLTREQVQTLNRIQKVQVYKLKASPEATRVLRWFVWKPIAIKQALEMFPYVLYTDAGTTILKPVDNLFKYIQQHKYFICTIGNEKINGQWRHPVNWGTTKFVRDSFKLESPENKWILSQEFVMGGVIGATREGFDVALKPVYDLTGDIRYFQDDGTAPNGMGCGRHDQTLLSICAYSKGLTINKQDYTQKVPMNLKVDGNDVPFHITWHPQYVSEKTSIYSSRGDTKNKAYYLSRIRYR